MKQVDSWKGASFPTELIKAIDELIKKYGPDPVAQASTWRTGIGVSVNK